MATDIGPLQSGNRSIGPLQAAGTLALTESVSDSLSFSDPLVLGSGSILSDLCSFSDSSGLLVGIPVVESDSFILSDSISVDLAIFSGLSVSISDSFVLADGSPIVEIDSPIFDNLDFSDSITVALVGQILIAVSDSFILGDSTAFPFSVNLAFGDSLSLLDYQVYDNYAFADQLFFSDFVSLFFGGAQVNDDLVFVDDLEVDDVILGLCRVPIDSITLGDSFVAIVNIPLTFGDFFILNDSNGFSIPLSINPATQFPPSIDNILFTDNVSISLSSEAFSDSITIADTSIVQTNCLIDLSDVITISDAASVNLIATIINLTITISDSINFADNSSFSLSGSESNSFADLVALSDAIQIGFGYAFNEAMSILDATEDGLVENYWDVADTVAFSDHVTISTIFTQIALSVSDTMVLSDVASGTAPIGSDTNYIRRYLNDVLHGG